MESFCSYKSEGRDCSGEDHIIYFICYEESHNCFKDSFVFFMMGKKVLCSSFQMSVIEMIMDI